MFFSKSKKLQQKLNRADIEKSALQFKLNESEHEYKKVIKEIKKLRSENIALKDKNTKLQDMLDESKEILELEISSGSSSHFEALDSLFTFENSNLKSSLLDIQSNIVLTTDEAKKSLSLNSTVDNEFDTSFKNIELINNTLNHLSLKSKSINTIVEDLSQKVKDIGNSLNQINEVVLQINILSLNASVEAATAGEAGKGFAVVASEVKNLANKTAGVAKEIEEVVKSIQENIVVTTDEFTSLDISIQDINKKTKTFDSELHHIYGTTKNSLDSLNVMSDGIFMSLAKLDHVIWKVNTYLSVADGKPAFKFVDHKNCRLGKWYESGDGAKHFSTTPSYRALEKPHSIVHNGTHQVFDMINEEKNNIDYIELKKAFEVMEEGSNEVFSVLDKILKERLG